MKMAMTDGEILASYRQAKDPAAQIGILADLNACKAGEIREKLIAMGAELPESQKRRRAAPANKRVPMDELRAMELYDGGASDLEMAETLGETQLRVAEWRRRMRLPAHKKPGEKDGRKQKEKGEPEEMKKQTEEPAEEKVLIHQELAAAPASATKGEDGGAVSEAARQMTAGALAKLLADVERGFPGAVVEAYEGEFVRGASVTVEYGPDGVPKGAAVLLL